mgnify:CR=1 FL=1
MIWPKDQEFDKNFKLSINAKALHLVLRMRIIADIGNYTHTVLMLILDILPIMCYTAIRKKVRMRYEVYFRF